MSVLNQSGEEQVECPLCMEPLEVDDLNFYPCTCGYQICRFCWHRIRTDENGLCPACRKAYSENPADFTPLSKEQVAQLKAEKRARDQQRKAKLSESRKHLAAVRVVQKNLVFVVGLPVRLADADVLKRHEYFGKFGKIHKVVINQSTSYAGSQGPSASAYVTYVKSDDALRAIQSVNNIMLDGRLIKSSLGTTKYCSHFMKNQPCPKADCMYLHDFGDPEASFTKEQMHVGKHQEYEKKLHDSLQTRTQQQQALAQAQQQQQQQLQQQQQQQSQHTAGGPAPDRGSDKSADTKDKDKAHKAKDANWPTLHGDTNSGFGNKTEKQQKSDSKSEKSQKKNNQKNKNNNNNTNSTNNNIENSKQKSDKEKTNSSKNCEQNSCSHHHHSQQQQQQQHQVQVTSQSPPNNTSQSPPTPPEVPTTQPIITPAPSSPLETTKQKEPHVVEPTTTTTTECLENLSKMQLIDDNSSFFSHNSFQKILPEDSTSFSNDSSSGATPHSNILNDNLPDITSSEDWQAAFGFSTNHKPEPIPNNTTRQIITENGFQQNGFANHLENYQIIKNNRETILDVLAGRGSHFNERLNPYANLNNKPENGLINGLDQQMSKFFAEFNNKNGFNHQTNGFVVDRPNFLGNQLNLNENQQHNNMLLLNYQQRLEDQALYNLKQNVFQQQQQQQQQQHNSQQYLHNHGTPMHHSGAQFLANGGEHYLSQNGQSFGNSGFTQNSVFQNQTLQQQRNLQQQLRGGDRASVDDDLGFDPFHETQKALAELIESEQGVQQIQNNGLLGSSSGGAATGSGSVAGSAGGPVNGLLAGGASQPHLPPPPGFMQHNTHMNSFGSKILPFLNMSNSQQISTSGGWSTNYSEAQLKGLAPVNDWMTLDPAIVSSSRHFPLANLPLREQFPPSLFQQSQTRGGAPFDYAPSHSNHNGYSQPQNPPHIPAYANGYTHHTPANPLNWFAGDLQGVSSPPGFRPASKTQEC